METLEKSRMCRLCGKNSGISIGIFDKNENHVRKINAILPIMVHEMDLLPKQMCHRCSYKLDEFYNFYVECAKTDTDLKSQLSWMNKDNLEEKITAPMVKMTPFKIKTEPSECDGSHNPKAMLGSKNEDSLLFPTSVLHGFDIVTTPILSCSRCRCICQNSMTDKESIKKIKHSPKSEKVIKAKNSDSHDKSKESHLQENKKDTHFYLNKDFINYEDISRMSGIKNFSDQKHEINNSNSNSDQLNRALRPRKGSVDYMGPKKKGLTSNLKEKLKSKLEMINSTVSLVNPVNFNQVSESTAINSDLVVKLEKVDDSLRTKKNLEEFNKRIKELKHNKNFKQNGQHPLGRYKTGKKDFHKELKILQKEHFKKHKSVSRETEKLSKTEPLKQFQTLDNENEETKSKVNIEQLKNKYNEASSDQMVFSKDDLQGSKDAMNIDKFPLCSVVKLENDFTCKVDYPRLKIKRHSSQSNSLNSALGEEKTNFEKQIVDKKKSNSKVVSRKEQKSSSKSKVSKKKRRRSDPTSLKQSFEERSMSTIPVIEVKRYCEQCKTSFITNELYKLHPCYQN